jgi:hypothetical protein
MVMPPFVAKETNLPQRRYTAGSFHWDAWLYFRNLAIALSNEKHIPRETSIDARARRLVQN